MADLSIDSWYEGSEIHGAVMWKLAAWETLILGDTQMRPDGIIFYLLISTGLFAIHGKLFAEASEATSAPEIHVFFGTNQVLSASELKTNALYALKSKGFSVSSSVHCGINVEVSGNRAECYVSFSDVAKKMLYTVEFNERGAISDIRGGPMIHHHTLAPNEPPPKLPDDVIRVTQEVITNQP